MFGVCAEEELRRRKYFYVIYFSLFYIYRDYLLAIAFVMK